jgi:hypothetical protein
MGDEHRRYQKGKSRAHPPGEDPHRVGVLHGAVLVAPGVGRQDHGAGEDHPMHAGRGGPVQETGHSHRRPQEHRRQQHARDQIAERAPRHADQGQQRRSRQEQRCREPRRAVKDRSAPAQGRRRIGEAQHEIGRPGQTAGETVRRPDGGGHGTAHRDPLGADSGWL